MVAAAPRQRGDREARERRREKGGTVRQPRQEHIGAESRRTGAIDGGGRQCGRGAVHVLATRGLGLPPPFLLVLVDESIVVDLQDSSMTDASRQRTGQHVLLRCFASRRVLHITDPATIEECRLTAHDIVFVNRPPAPLCTSPPKRLSAGILLPSVVVHADEVRLRRLFTEPTSARRR
ncbi:hypothetical protein ZWY2020_025864 [Hordeum vulgare]|nr:hypothetical protein ZWY2020_025864 [Hordeum vulgare]